MNAGADALIRVTSSSEGIATVVLERPAKANALRVSDKRAVADAVKALGSDDATRAIVITGAGDRAFCAGSDIAEMQAFGPREMFEMLAAEREMYRSVAECPKPVVAAVNGYALGAGMILAISCDYAVGSIDAQFGTPELTIGVAAPLEGFLLPWIVGLGRARSMFFTGERVDAEEARRIGVIQEVAPAGECVTRAVAAAARMAGLPGSAFRIQKALLRLLIDTGDLAAVVDASHYATATQFAAPETTAAMRTFLQRRG